MCSKASRHACERVWSNNGVQISMGARRRQRWVSRLFHVNPPMACRSSEQPHPQTALRDTPVLLQLQPWTGPLQAHSSEQPQSWLSDDPGVVDFKTSSAPCAPVKSTSARANVRVRTTTAFILRPSPVITPWRQYCKDQHGERRSGGSDQEMTNRSTSGYLGDWSEPLSIRRSRPPGSRQRALPRLRRSRFVKPPRSRPCRVRLRHYCP